MAAIKEQNEKADGHKNQLFCIHSFHLQERPLSEVWLYSKRA
ncbi:hypothetical protein B4107_1764 [Bacillus safensis]|nr:hypothetical protein B4107_1764 [Bacillus safensis]